ncbi:MAG: hypothetical protein WC485_11120 [Opitutaceae bacterium]
MPSLDPRHRLLADILNDDSFIEHRERLLVASAQGLRQRRRNRAVQLLFVPLAACLALAALVMNWPAIQSGGRTVPKTVSAAPCQTDKASGAMDATSGNVFVSTADILRVPSIAFVEFNTAQVPLGLQMISDQELLALFADHGAMLVSSRDGVKLWLQQNGRLRAIQ